MFSKGKMMVVEPVCDTTHRFMKGRFKALSLAYLLLSFLVSGPENPHLSNRIYISLPLFFLNLADASPTDMTITFPIHTTKKRSTLH